ncbi:phage tail family protein [Hazenella sp. IB182357]|uniref:Phage tail family protein n=1 Tax=Polycladospora coralii TaxID=2771432 RepID=A0A926RT82_9BACL|nr:distal tail protein Dit [Polycladospora coralii]MBD1372495.1 phage tail family protein [Polycladospora coralii]
MAIKFNDVVIPDFVIVNAVKTTSIPPISQKVITVPGKAGSYDFGNTLDNREITVDYTIVSKSSRDLRQKTRELANWLYYEEAKKLVLLDEPDKYYLCKLSGSTDLEEVAHIGQGSLTFVCTDPFSYGEETTIQLNPADENPIEVENDGGITASPIIEMTFTEDTTEFGILSGDEFMYFGKPAPVGRVITPKRSLVLNDDCSSISNWTTGSYADGAIIQGSFRSDGEKMLVDKFDTTENQIGWHGPALVKTLDNNETIQDFTAEFRFTFRPKDIKNVQRLELYLLDVNGASIGKIALIDAWSSSNRTRVGARAGALGTGYYFVNTEVGTNYYSSFYGYMRIKRSGKHWRFGIGKIIDGNYWDSWSTRYYDNDEKFMEKLAAVQIHTAAHGKYTPREQVYIHNVRVWKNNTLSDEEIPYVFQEGDQLKIDCGTGTILKNNEPFYEPLDPGSTFIQLEKGSNGIATVPAIIKNGKITYQKRWL